MNSKEEVIKNVLEGKVRLEDLSEEEKKGFDGDSEISAIERILHTTEDWQVPDTPEIDSNWNSLLNRIEQEEKSVRRLSWLPMAAAVSFLMLVSYFVWFVPGTVTVQTGVAELKEVILPDNSTVLLNANSRITYSEDWDRRIELEGKGRFVVSEGKKFEVWTGSYTTTVLGTEFDVTFGDDKFEVRCYSGEVSVSDGSSDELLTRGEKALAVSGELVTQTFDPEPSSRWTSGEFHFDGVPLKEVALELERQFDLEIRGLEPSDRTYQGYFFKDNLEEALELVFDPMGYEYELKGRVLMIK